MVELYLKRDVEEIMHGLMSRLGRKQEFVNFQK